MNKSIKQALIAQGSFALVWIAFMAGLDGLLGATAAVTGCAFGFFICNLLGVYDSKSR